MDSPSRSPQKSSNVSQLNDTSPLPSINERLGHLRPSKELLEYYRLKIAEFDDEYEALSRKLDLYKCTYEDQHKHEWEMRQREEEIAELQKALSDMQVYLFQEREHVLRLYSENDRLKIRELEDRKKIQHLLSLTQPVCSEITYFHKEPHRKVLVNQYKPHQREAGEEGGSDGEEGTANGRGPGGHKHIHISKTRHKKVVSKKEDSEGSEPDIDQETMVLTVSSLKAQLEEQTRLCRDQVDGLLEDRRVQQEEYQAKEERDKAQIRGLMERLQNAQSLLYQSTKDYLDLKYELRTRERGWMAEKDKLLRKMDAYKQQVDESQGIDPVLGMSFAEPSEESGATRATVNQLKLQLQQVQQLAENYREQCVKMEDEVCQLREEVEASRELFKEKASKAVKRLEVVNTRYNTLEKRRDLEIQGYKADIKMLRKRLSELEKQLYKLTLSMSGAQDTEVLSAVKKTTANTRRLLGDLQHLKTKVYGMEKKVLTVHN